MNSVRSAQPRVRVSDDRAARIRADRRLLTRYQLDRDAAARAALVERFLPLARQLARRYAGGGEPLDDLVQVASVGLLKAIDRFDVDRTTAFSSFAVPTMLGELRRHFRDNGWSVRVPRDLQELAARLEMVTDELARTSARRPTVDEIARHIGVSPERVIEGRAAAGAHRAVSLDPPARDSDDDEHVGLSMSLGAEDPGYGRAEDAVTVGHLMRGLGDREREVLRLRFAEDLTQSEIGARVGISQMQVSRLIRRALSKLRRVADATERKEQELEGETET
jgi:RNA polymerase sigma-B factor